MTPDSKNETPKRVGAVAPWFAFVATQFQYIGLREKHRVSLGPFSRTNAEKLAAHMNRFKTGMPAKVVAATSAPRATNGWSTRSAPAWVSRLLKRENERILKANDRDEPRPANHH